MYQKPSSAMMAAMARTAAAISDYRARPAASTDFAAQSRDEILAGNLRVVERLSDGPS
jgi:hypothetical protein